MTGHIRSVRCIGPYEFAWGRTKLGITKFKAKLIALPYQLHSFDSAPFLTSEQACCPLRLGIGHGLAVLASCLSPS